MLTPKQGRSLAWMLLGAWAVTVLSWLGVAALVTLSVLWPANQVPHVLLAVWLCAIAGRVIWLARRPGLHEDWPVRILFAPLGLVISLRRLVAGDARLRRP